MSLEILQVLLSPRIGGAEAAADALESSWARAGVVARTIYLDPHGQKLSRRLRLAGIQKQVKRLNPRLIVAHSYLPAAYTRAAVGGRWPVHVVLHSAADDYSSLVSRVVERALISRTSSVIAVSTTQAESYRRHFPGLPQLTVIPNGVSARFAPKERASPTMIRLITVARAVPQKRPDLWAQVAKKAQSLLPNLVFEWWGPVSDAESAKAFEHLTPNARYMGATNEPELLMLSSDLLFHTAEREAHSVTLMEAAVAGLPILYSNSLERPGEEPVWDLQFDLTADDAIAALRRISNEWDRINVRAIEYATRARTVFSADAMATNYTSWMLDNQAKGRQ